MMRFGGMLNQETVKPRALGETIARLGRYGGLMEGRGCEVCRHGQHQMQFGYYATCFIT